jgi:general secretion pathway protein D
MALIGARSRPDTGRYHLRAPRATVAAIVTAVAVAAAAPRPLAAQQDSAVTQRGDSVSIRLIDVDIRAAVQALARYLDRPVLFGNVGASRVTVETPRPIPRREVADLLRRLVESQSLELVADSTGPYVVRTREAPKPAAPAEPKPTPEGPPQLFVIRLHHARAADVAATVNAIYGRASALGELGARARPLSRELAANQVPPAGEQAQMPGASPPQGAGRPAVLSGEVTIIPDPSTNSLLVRATPTDFELITAAVQQIDIRPLQVLIEVLIAEIRRDRSLSFGVDAQLPQVATGQGNTTIGGSLSGPSLSDFVVKVMKIGSGDLDATLRAAASRGDVSIVSRPVVIAANNQEAEILVGSQRPFVQVSRSLPTDAATRDQIVQYKDVGTKLRVLPTISADGYVMLQVIQEVNTATEETQFNAPIISTRSVQTELLIKSGQTVVLGGLTDRQRDRTQSGVPVLSSIPFLGGFFGKATRRTTETELFLFLTPRVIQSDAEANALTAPLQKRAEQSKP